MLAPESKSAFPTASSLKVYLQVSDLMDMPGGKEIFMTEEQEAALQEAGGQE